MTAGALVIQKLHIGVVLTRYKHFPNLYVLFIKGQIVIDMEYALDHIPLPNHIRHPDSELLF